MSSMDFRSFHRRRSSILLESRYNNEIAHFFTDLIHSQRMSVYCSPFNSSCILSLSKFCLKDMNRQTCGRGFNEKNLLPLTFAFLVLTMGYYNSQRDFSPQVTL